MAKFNKKKLPSRHTSLGADRAPHRSFYYAMGETEKDVAKPFVGVVSTWNEAAPCNIALMRQAQSVKKGVRANGGTPREFCTITVTDGIAMGHEGMKSSLISREVIADSAELTVRGHCYDALVGIAGCDKSLPGLMMSMVRLNVPSVFIYGGSILPGKYKGKDVTVVDVFEAVGKHSSGQMSAKELRKLELVACPSAGACGGQFTANTMACVSEAIGLALPYSAGTPAPYEEYEHAKARGAKIYAELTGYGASSDGYDMVAPSGEGAVRCMKMALSTSKNKIDYINTHGTSTPVGDITELNAVGDAFGEDIPKISSTKSLSGHPLGAASVHEAIYSLIMMKNSFITASANINDMDEDAKKYPIVTQTEKNVSLNSVMSNSFGFGGTNATLIFEKV